MFSHLKIPPPLGLHLLVAVGLMLVLLALYYPGAHGPYLLDDYGVLTHNDRLLMKELSWAELKEAALSTERGPLRRPIAVGSFALNFHFAGNTDAYSIKLTNILLHLVTAAGIYLLTIQLLRALERSPVQSAFHRGAALFITALWALHPLHVSTVLYSVQRMSILVALFTVYAMLAYLHGRRQLAWRSTPGLLWCLGAIAMGGTLATLSKENGVLLVFFLLVVEAVVFRWRLPEGTGRVPAAILRVLLVGPTLAVVGYLLLQMLVHPAGNPFRDFTLWERLLTEARVLFHYARLILWPDLHGMGLFQDDFVVSRGWLAPPHTLAAVLGCVGVLVSAIWLANKRLGLPWAFGLLWFFAAHLLESTVIQLELVFEHRNYLAAFGLLFPLGYTLARWTAHTTSRPLLRVAFLGVFVIYLAGQTGERVTSWKDAFTLAGWELSRHPESGRAWAFAGITLAEAGRPEEALFPFLQAAEHDRREAAPLLQYLAVAASAARPIPTEVVDELTRRLTLYPIGHRTANQLYLLGPQVERRWPQLPLLIAVYRTATENEVWASAQFRGVSLLRLGEWLGWQGETEAAKAASRAGVRMLNEAGVAVRRAPGE